MATEQAAKCPLLLKPKKALHPIQAVATGQAAKNLWNPGSRTRDHSDYTYYDPPRPQEGQPYNHQARNDAGNVLLSQPSRHGSTPFHNLPRASPFASTGELQAAYLQSYDPFEPSMFSSYLDPTSGTASTYDASSNYHQSDMHPGELDYQPIPEEDLEVAAGESAENRASTLESNRQYMANYREQNRDKLLPKQRVYMANYRKLNGAKLAAQKRARRAKKKLNDALHPPSG